MLTVYRHDEYIIITLLTGGPQPVKDLHTSQPTSQTLNVTFTPQFNGGLNQSFTIQYKLASDPDEDEYYTQYAQCEYYIQYAQGALHTVCSG